MLCTEITCENGKYRVIDVVPRFKHYERFFKPLMLIRKIEPIEGSPIIIVKCRPVAEYGAKQLKVHCGSNHVEFEGGEDTIRLTTNIPISYLAEDAHFVLNEVKYLILTYG